MKKSIKTKIAFTRIKKKNTSYKNFPPKHISVGPTTSTNPVKTSQNFLNQIFAWITHFFQSTKNIRPKINVNNLKSRKFSILPSHRIFIIPWKKYINIDFFFLFQAKDHIWKISQLFGPFPFPKTIYLHIYKKKKSSAIQKKDGADNCYCRIKRLCEEDIQTLTQNKLNFYLQTHRLR